MNLKITQAFFYTVLIFALIGCASQKYVHPAITNYSEPIRIGVLKPVSAIGVISEGNRAHFDSLLSIQTNEQIFNNTISIPKGGIYSKKIEADTTVNNIIYREVFTLTKKQYSQKGAAKRQQVMASYVLPDTLIKFMEANEVDQLIVTFHRGFTRTKQNYRNQNLKGLGVGLLTLGMYVQTPIKANSHLYTWILDAKAKTVVFNNASIMNTEPVEPLTLMRQLCELYEGVFTTKSQTGACFSL